LQPIKKWVATSAIRSLKIGKQQYVNFKSYGKVEA